MVQEAKRLYTEGLAHARNEDWVRARQAFEASLERARVPATVFNLAVALEEAGAWSEALARYREFLEIAEGNRGARRFVPTATEHARDLERSMPRLTVTVEDDSRTGANLVIDGTRYSFSAAAEGLPVDPGQHEVTLERGTQNVSRAVTMGAGEAQELSLELPDLRPASVDPAFEPASTTVLLEEEPASNRTGLWVGLGVGAAVLAGVAVAVGIALSPSDEPFASSAGTIAFQ